MERIVFYLLMHQKCINLNKAKDSEIKPYPLCLGNISKNFTINNMKKTEIAKVFSVDYNAIDTSDILGIHIVYERNAR